MNNYQVQRALVVDGQIFNLGDDILIILDSGETVACRLDSILWIDEYTASLETTRGSFNLDTVARIEKLEII